MSTEIPLKDRILDATQQVLRRHGAEKTNVVDVANLLDMSPGNVYRFFPSKKELFAAVALRWIDEINGPMKGIATDKSRSASDRLTAWFDTIRKAKRRKLVDEPELFRVYLDIMGDMRKTAEEHIHSLLEQLEQIIRDGKKAGEFPAATDAKSAARSFLFATSAFHHPALVVQQPAPTEAEARAVIRMVIAGLQAGC